MTESTPTPVITTPSGTEIAPPSAPFTIAVIGGTGPQGKGLGYRFARAGHTVVFGSRAAEKGQAVADEVAARLEGAEGAGVVSGAANADAAAQADVVLLAVPWDGHDEIGRAHV